MSLPNNDRRAPASTLGALGQRIRDLADALIAPLPAVRSPSEQSQWILAQLLEWHRREEKAVWW